MDEASTGRPTRRSILKFAGGAAALGAIGLTAACSSSGDSAEASPAASGGVIGGGGPNDQYYFVTLNLADPFYETGIRGMDLFAKTFGVKAQAVGPQDLSIAEFSKTFEQVVSKPGTAGILTYAIDFESVKPLYQQAADKGIAVINGTNDWGTPRASFVGESVPDKVDIAVGLLKESLGGSGSVGIMGNTGGDVPERVKLFEEAVKKAGLQYAGLQTHDGSVAGATKAAQAFVSANPDMKGMWFSDGLSGSVAAPIHDAAPDLKLLLTDVTEGALKAVKAGQGIGTLGRSTFDEEFYGFQLAYWWHAGYRVPDSVTLTQIVVTPENVDEAIANPDKRTGFIA